MVTIAVCDDHYQDLQLTKQQIEQIITAHYAGIPHQILLYSSGNALLKDTAILNTIDLLFLDISFLIFPVLKSLQESRSFATVLLLYFYPSANGKCIKAFNTSLSVL